MANDLLFFPPQPRVYKKSPLETLVAKTPVAAPAPPPPVKKAPLAPPPPAVYSGPVTPIKSGLDAFNIVRDVVVDQLRVEPSSLSESAWLQATHWVCTF